MIYEPRVYRRWVDTQDLVAFNVTVKETDLYVLASSNLKRKTHRLVLKYRRMLEEYIEHNPDFLTSLEPVPISPAAPLIVKAMAEATARVGVGPMAAVAGAIAEFVGIELMAFTPDIIIENGGDIYLKSSRKRIVAIYAGKSLLSGKIGLEIEGKDTPLGVCTSSGTVGHSLSFGRADAVVTVAGSATLADAAATALGNLVKEPEDFARAIDYGKSIEGLRGVVIIKDDKMGVWGDIKLCRIAGLT